MKQYIAYLLIGTFLVFGACGQGTNKAKQDSAHSHEGHNHEGHNHDDHDHDHEGHDHEGHNHDKDHEGHDHSHEGHDHGSEGHNHEGHEGHDHGSEGHSHGDGEESHNPDEIVFTKAQALASGLEVVNVKPTSFQQVIKTSGQILSAQGDEVNVVAKSSGIVSFNKSVSEGTYVKSGEVFVSISSKSIGEGDPAQKALYAYNNAKKELDRANLLIGERLISQKDYNQINLDYETALVAYQAFAKTRTAKGVSVSSPIAGYVKSKFVSEGDFVEIGQTIAIITQNKKMQLRAEVPERHYHNLGNIVTANFKTPYNDKVYKMSDLNGKLLSFGKSSSNENVFIPINFEFESNTNVVSGSYVEVFLLSKTLDNIISVPVSSLIEEQGLYFVFLQLNDEHYKKQEVKLGENDGIKVHVLAGLNVGDNVVSKSAYHVKLASASTDVPHGHSH